MTRKRRPDGTGRKPPVAPSDPLVAPGLHPPLARSCDGPPPAPGSLPEVPIDAGVLLLAVIDVGSAAIRMAIGEAVRGRPLRRLEALEAPLAIGLDTLSRGHISSVTTEATIRTLKDFTRVMASYGLDPRGCRAVATTAVRDARNRDVFLDRVLQGSGLRIEVLEAIEELRLIYQVLRPGLGERLSHGSFLLLVLGSGGTQLVLQQEGCIRFEETLTYGLLKLAEYSEGPSVRPVRSFLDKVARAVDRVHDLSRLDSLVVVSRETQRLLEALSHGRHRALGLELGRQELKRAHALLSAESNDELLSRYELDLPTAERGRLALEEVMAFLQASACQTVLVLDTSMLDSLLMDARLRAEAVAGVEPMEREVEQAAWSLGRKYRHDEAHAGVVRRLALELFETLQGLTHLTSRSRLLLSVAAILHDIGYFISPRHHEQHSEYLILSSEFMGLTRDEVERIALLARFHRRQVSALASPALGRLPSAHRVEVLKLAALLRLSEALDQDHLGRVLRLRVAPRADTLRIGAETRSGDQESFAAIALAFRRKADLFEEIFGLLPILDEVLVP